MPSGDSDNPLIIFTGRNDSRLKPGANFAGQRLGGKTGKVDLSHACFEGASFEGITLKGTKLCGSNFKMATIVKANLCGADLTNVKNLGTVRGLGNAKMDDATILEGIEFDKEFPGDENRDLKRKLQKTRRFGRFKQKHPWRYLIAYSLSNGGRNPFHLVGLPILVILLFALAFFSGTVGFHGPCLEGVSVGNHLLVFSECLSFSVWTFGPLSHGVVVPADPMSKWWADTERVVGFVLTAALCSCLGALFLSSSPFD